MPSNRDERKKYEKSTSEEQENFSKLNFAAEISSKCDAVCH